MSLEGYGALMGSNEPEMSIDDKLRIITQSLLSLKKVSSSIIDLYATMHSSLLTELHKQLNFDVKIYSEQLDATMKDLMLKRERLEDEIYGICKVEDAIIQGDIAKLVIDRVEGDKAFSNRNIGGTYYIIGKSQLLPTIEAQIVGHKTGEIIELECVEDNKNVKYTVEILGVKRRRTDDIPTKQS